MFSQNVSASFGGSKSIPRSVGLCFECVRSEQPRFWSTDVATRGDEIHEIVRQARPPPQIQAVLVPAEDPVKINPKVFWTNLAWQVGICCSGIGLLLMSLSLGPVWFWIVFGFLCMIGVSILIARER